MIPTSFEFGIVVSITVLESVICLPSIYSNLVTLSELSPLGYFSSISIADWSLDLSSLDYFEAFIVDSYVLAGLIGGGDGSLVFDEAFLVTYFPFLPYLLSLPPGFGIEGPPPLPPGAPKKAAFFFSASLYRSRSS